jgi:hypothetical protein
MSNFDPLRPKHFVLKVGIANETERDRGGGAAWAWLTIARNGVETQFADIDENWFQRITVPDPDVEVYGFDARAAGSRFAVRLSVRFAVFLTQGTGSLEFDFQDSWLWEEPASERLVGRTMQETDRIRSLPDTPTGEGWVQTHGGWRHGVFFRCRRFDLNTGRYV